ncbi:MAG: SDR family oxidoreductase [Pseudomonadota bacterium]
MTAPVLIYGGTGGIGSEIARRLTASGMPVHLIARSEDRLRTLAGEIGAGYTAANVMDSDAISRATDAAAKDGLSGLVYAVGTINLKPVARLDDADFERDFKLNALGAVKAVQAVLPHLKRANAPAILLFSTVAVQQGFASHASVAMAKGAVEGLTRALAAELAPRIRVNAIAPSLTRTDLAGPLLSNEQMAKGLAQAHPLGRLGEPDDIAGLGAFLMSPSASWITGQIIAVDGGRGALRTRG